MRKAIDLTGKTFGRLTVLEFSHRKENGLYWRCKCSCGRETIAHGHSLRKGQKKSCGCLRSENLKGRRNAANICIDCKKSVGECPWSAVDQKTGKLKFEPVPGWTATKTTIRLSSDRKNKARFAETYAIKACPLFERDSREESPNEKCLP